MICNYMLLHCYDVCVLCMLDYRLMYRSILLTSGLSKARGTHPSLCQGEKVHSVSDILRSTPIPNGRFAINHIKAGYRTRSDLLTPLGHRYVPIDEASLRLFAPGASQDVASGVHRRPMVHDQKLPRISERGRDEAQPGGYSTHVRSTSTCSRRDELCR